MNINVSPASDNEQTLVKNLVPFYVYDMSEYMGWDCNSEGRWDGCDELPEYWEQTDYFPYLIRVDSKLAGFALVRPYPKDPERFEIGEFFVARKFKGLGVGRTSAFQLFEKHPGKWIVRVLDGNHGARVFWAKVIKEFTSGEFIQTSDQYDDPYSGVWNMQFYQFRSEGANQSLQETTSDAPRPS